MESDVGSRLQDRRDALTTRCADRNQPADGLAGLLLLLGQLLGQLRDDPSAGRGERVAGGERRPVDIELGPVDRAECAVQAEPLLAVLLGLPGLQVGENSFVMEANVIQPFASIGDNTILWSGNHIGHHARIGDHCFLASHIVVSGGVEIGDHCFIGVNATLRDGIKIAPRCLIGAGALITKNTMPDEVYAPAATAASAVPSSRVSP